MVDVNQKKKDKKKEKEKKQPIYKTPHKVVDVNQKKTKTKKGKREETGGRKEHVDDVRKRNMFTLISWLLLDCF